MASRSSEWRTPTNLFKALHARYRFDVDAAASHANAMLPKFFTRRQDGLAQDWAPMRIWCNPPYGRDIGLWTAKAAGANTFVLMLIPARTDTAWWHEHIITKSTQIAYVRGRLRFQGAPWSAPFPSALVMFDPKRKRQPPVAMDTQGNVLRVIGP